MEFGSRGGGKTRKGEKKAKRTEIRLLLKEGEGGDLRKVLTGGLTRPSPEEDNHPKGEGQRF